MPSASPSPDNDSLCARIQQFRQRMRARCIEHRATSEDAPATGIPCLLQSWRKRIEAMEDEPQTHNHRARHCRRPSNTSDSDASSCPFRGPRMLHPRLERQQAVCSLSEIWSGFTSSPPPSPEIYAKPRHRRHPYSRCFTDDHRKASQ